MPFTSLNFRKIRCISMKSLRVLITGGAGFIGSHLASEFANWADVRILDDFRTGLASNIASIPHTLFHGSISDTTLVARAMDGVDYVFHLAAMVSVPESMIQPNLCVEVNTLGTLHVLEAAANAGVKKLVLSSTAAIYGDDPVLPKHESLVPRPRSPYAVTKLDGEYYCDMFTRTGRLETACLRYFNVFGPRQNPKSAYAAAVPIFIEKALQNAPVVIYGDGCQTRDLVHVSDIVGANRHIAMHETASGIFNVACGRSITILELAHKIIRITGSRSTIEFLDSRIGDVRHSLADTQALSATGYVCDNAIDRLLLQTVESYR